MKPSENDAHSSAQDRSTGPVHRNNFDALRVAAALLVLFSHQFSVMGLPQPFEVFGRTLGELAVGVFFTISGYLISQSWLADPSVVRFSAKRLLRVYPGLIVVLILSACVLGPILTDINLRSYFTAPITWQYLSDNTAMHIVYKLPGVFLHNAFPQAVNGSLWTLPYELRWYLYLLVFGIAGLLRHSAFVAALWCFMFIHYFFIYNIDTALLNHGDHRWAEELGLFFAGGMLLLSTQAWWRQRRLALLAVTLCGSTILLLSGRPNAALTLAVPVLTILVGTLRTPWLAKATLFGDLSYGIYIYAFPVQQTLWLVTGNRLGLAATMLICCGSTLVLAYLSWHCVEKHALHFKRWFPRPHTAPVRQH